MEILEGDLVQMNSGKWGLYDQISVLIRGDKKSLPLPLSEGTEERVPPMS